MLQAGADALGDVTGRFDVVTLNVDDADGDVFGLRNPADEFQFGKFAAGHLHVDFVHV